MEKRLTILGISGSPRRNANTETLLDALLQSAHTQGARCEKIILSRLHICSCTGCRSCYRAGKCRIKDDFNALAKKLSAADRIVLASPLHFRSVSSLTKTFIDRLQVFWVKKYVLRPRGAAKAVKKRKGIFLCVSSHDDPQGFAAARMTVKAALSVMDVALTQTLYVPGVEEKRDVSGNKKALCAAHALGALLVKRHGA